MIIRSEIKSNFTCIPNEIFTDGGNQAGKETASPCTVNHSNLNLSLTENPISGYPVTVAANSAAPVSQPDNVGAKTAPYYYERYFCTYAPIGQHGGNSFELPVPTYRSANPSCCPFYFSQNEKGRTLNVGRPHHVRTEPAPLLYPHLIDYDLPKIQFKREVQS